MSAVMEMPQSIANGRVVANGRTSATGRYLFTVEDYDRMIETGILTEDDRVELIKGEIRIMSPKGPKHSSGNTRVNRCFTKLLDDRAIIRIQDPIRLDDFSEPEPDLVVAVLTEDEYDYHHPTPQEVLFVLEVADTSLASDREEKGLIYAQAGIRQYCILNLRDRELEDYRKPGASGYRSKETYTAEQRFNLAAFPDVWIAVNDLLPRPGKPKNPRKKK